VYQATSGPIFVFISTITKVPFIIPFVWLSKSYFVLPNSWIFFYIIILITWGTVLAARDLLTETNFRRIMAYTSTINFCTAVLGLIFSLYNTKIFIAFIANYLISNLSVYLWHYLLNTDKLGINEITNISKFNKNNKFAAIILTITVIFNSGLPPITIFILKLISVGAITFFSPYNYSIFNMFIAIIIILSSISSYYVYFNILKTVNYSRPDETPNIYEGINYKNYKIYNFSIFITLLSIISFFFIIFIL
jgi:NADH:ubiquinone oxidoreductase subunit 2 (subunit N)